MNLQLLKNKFRALGIHLCISSVILAALLAMIIFWWYPGIWFSIDGGWQGVRIMVLVDMVLGPLLTLVIFNPGKTRRHIIFDLSCIAAIQVAALIGGVYTVHSQRPLAITYWDGEFYSVDAQELAKFDTTAADLDKFNQKLPLIIAARPPESAEEKTAIAISLFTDGPMMYADIDRYGELNTYRDSILASSVNIKEKADKNLELGKNLDHFLDRHKDSSLDDFLFLPFNGRFGHYQLILDQELNILGYLPD